MKSNPKPNPNLEAQRPPISLPDWAAAQVWPSLDSIQEHMKCPRPLVGSGGYHWWYNDHESMEAMEDAGVQIPYVPIVCKSCGLKLKLSADAPEYPAI